VTQPRSFLLTGHDAGGTVPPMIALAQVLGDRGHRVAVLSQPSVKARAEAAGCRFSAFSAAADYEKGTAIEEQLAVAGAIITGATVGEDLLAASEASAADLVVVDGNLAGALAAAETLTQPSVVLLHSMYATFVDTWFADNWPLLEPAVNHTRAGLGLDPASGWPAVFAPHDRILSVVPSAFEAPVAERPATLRNFGFLVPRPARVGGGGEFPPGDGPAVLVGLSTTYQHQDALLGSILDALGSLDVRGLVTTAGQVRLEPRRIPANVVVRDFVDHPSVLPRTDVLVTHAGLGTVAAALTFGVPMVCTPLGRDQPLNAGRVAALGAGVVLADDPGAAELAGAIEHVLANPSLRRAAEAIGHESRREGGSSTAVDELEALLGA
jgi:UDP:flavonoid glycosyltransferase YjiC (YdhE family)